MAETISDFGPLFQFAKLRDRTLGLYSSGWTGTADECAAVLHEDKLSIRPRVSELRKQGLLTAIARRNGMNVWRRA